MVRPFFKWIVSAEAQDEASKPHKAKKMTRNRIQAHSSNEGPRNHVTKVPSTNRALWIAVCLSTFLTFPASFAAAEGSPEKPAETLYLKLGSIGLNPAQVYQVRGASLNRSSVQITLEDGTIAFTQDVMGRVTGAFFEGEGEVLLTPPNAVERRSMSIFTGMAILEERFASAYFRFNDDAVTELRPDLRATNDKQQFVDHWNQTAQNLASADAMRLLVTFSRMLPASGGSIPQAIGASGKTGQPDRFLHARLQGTKLGVFDIYFDSMAPELIQTGQVKTTDKGETYYDEWSSFSPVQAAAPEAGLSHALSDESAQVDESSIAVRQFTISTQVLPPKQIVARASVECEVLQSGSRVLLFELSRSLKIESVLLDGKAVEFIHNPALEGTQLSRQGNDLVAVMLPEPATAGKRVNLEFKYTGEVLAEAGGGLLYVGERGTWYPNRGMEMASFDLEFTYPQDWTLVATGKPSPVAPERATPAAGQQISRWVSERPIPLAGFNLGKYREAVARAGDVSVEVYATQGVEKDFPTGSIQVVAPIPSEPALLRPPNVIAAPRPSPVKNEVSVGGSAARAIQYFSDRFGPFPYSHIALTQMPGRDSQGWPGLVFLSSYAFLNNEDREQLHFQPHRALITQSIPAHEVAHQYWGDLITWKSYRDQWFSEGLANYCALMILQEKNPAGFRQVMDSYRNDLVEKNKDGVAPMEAGPVTLGTRLLSSHFPDGYEAISYGRGTWLFHMLRTMLKDAASQSSAHKPTSQATDEPFVAALRRVRQRYEGKAISTRELLD